MAIIDDDPAILRALSRMLKVRGHEVSAFGSAARFLEVVDQEPPEVLLLDLRMPDLNGLEVQQELVKRGFDIPTVFLSAHGDVTTSVKALHGGAADFLVKPCDESVLLSSLQRATEAGRMHRARRLEVQEVVVRARSLTPRERQVFALLVRGRMNKHIAAVLGTSTRTIKVHRARVMAKMRADSIADLVRMHDELPAEVRPPMPREET